MKRNYLIPILTILLVLLLLPGALMTQKSQSGFSCHAYDAQGKILRGYQSEVDGGWYLFVPSTQDISEIRLHCTGQVTETSGGLLDQNVITGGFRNSGDHLMLTGEDGMQRTVTVLQSQLPSVYVDLARATLDNIHKDQNQKFDSNSLHIMDPAGNWDLTVKDSVQIKGRGNSSWREYEKKGYQIRFETEMSVMGMAKAEKWVLLANASDDSMMRTQLVSRMAEDLRLDFAASFVYVDLWIEGEYLGTYLLGEKVEPGSGRLNLKNPSGALFEHDEAFYLEETHWFLSRYLNRHFTLKEIVEERDAMIRSAMTDFETAVDTLIRYLYETPSHEVTLETLSGMIDVDSFIQYYLINEYALNRESFSTSFYWYQDGPEDVIHLGPIWDFDTCMGNDKEPFTASYGENHVMFRYLLAAPAFYERTMELLETYREELESMTEDVDLLRNQIADSAKMNYLRWNVLGKPNPKGGTDFASTFDGAADNLKQWLRGRETGFRVVRNKVASSLVSEDCRTITVTFQPEKDYETIMVALWSAENGDDDLNWYRAARAEDGSWRCGIELENHNCAGLYYYNVYTENQQNLLATGRNYVHTARSARYELTLEVEESSGELALYLKDTTDVMTVVRFDIWGAAAQDTSFHRLQAEQNRQGIWTARIPLCAFGLSEAEDLVIQAYGVDQNMEIRLNEKLFPLETVFSHTYPAGASGPCAACGREPGAREFLAKTPIYCLYDSGSDQWFYTGSTIERDILLSAGWQDGGIGWYAPIFSGEPVYRLADPVTMNRLFTLDSAEVARLTESGWNVEGIGWNSYEGGQPVYRLHDPLRTQGSYCYTADEAERDALMAQGWLCEGIGWYAAPDF